MESIKRRVNLKNNLSFIHFIQFIHQVHNNKVKFKRFIIWTESFIVLKLAFKVIHLLTVIITTIEWNIFLVITKIVCNIITTEINTDRILIESKSFSTGQTNNTSTLFFASSTLERTFCTSGGIQIIALNTSLAIILCSGTRCTSLWAFFTSSWTQIITCNAKRTIISIRLAGSALLITFITYIISAEITSKTRRTLFVVRWKTSFAIRVAWTTSFILIHSIIIITLHTYWKVLVTSVTVWVFTFCTFSICIDPIVIDTRFTLIAFVSTNTTMNISAIDTIAHIIGIKSSHTLLTDIIVLGTFQAVCFTFFAVIIIIYKDTISILTSFTTRVIIKTSVTIGSLTFRTDSWGVSIWKSIITVTLPTTIYCAQMTFGKPTNTCYTYPILLKLKFFTR